MSVSLACPICQTKLSPPAGLAIGEALTCDSCGTSFLFPGANPPRGAPLTMVVRRPRALDALKREPADPPLSGMALVMRNLALVTAGVVTAVGLIILALLFWQLRQAVPDPNATMPTVPAPAPSRPQNDGIVSPPGRDFRTNPPRRPEDMPRRDQAPSDQ